MAQGRPIKIILYIIASNIGPASIEHKNPVALGIPNDVSYTIGITGIFPAKQDIALNIAEQGIIDNLGRSGLLNDDALLNYLK